jgi:hypothetical protein
VECRIVGRGFGLEAANESVRADQLQEGGGPGKTRLDGSQKKSGDTGLRTTTLHTVHIHLHRRAGWHNL